MVRRGFAALQPYMSAAWPAANKLKIGRAADRLFWASQRGRSGDATARKPAHYRIPT
jgi:hypothetical protein